MGGEESLKCRNYRYAHCLDSTILNVLSLFCDLPNHPKIRSNFTTKYATMHLQKNKDTLLYNHNIIITIKVENTISSIMF